MELDSVRSLKQQIASPEGQAKIEHVHRQAQKAKPQNSISVASAAASVVGWAGFAQMLLPTLGVGHRQGGSFHLAVRIDDDHPSKHEIAEHLKQESRGEIDVRFVGPIHAHEDPKPWYQCETRPLRIGCSASEYDVRGGTLGCFVTDLDGKNLYMLSNNHVFAREDTAPEGAAILQPGIMDQGKPANSVGRFVRAVPLQETGNRVDCALASIDPGVEHDLHHLEGFGKLQGLRKTLPDHHEVLYKIGRTTGTTAAYVSALEMDHVRIRFLMGTKRTFDDQIEVEVAQKRLSKLVDDTKRFTDGGDSGSLVFDDQQRAVGLLFAGNDKLGYINPLQAVLDALQVKLADTPDL